jgi:hypothetical protein
VLRMHDDEIPKEVTLDKLKSRWGKQVLKDVV